jgi:hypothetical protein
LRTKEWTLSFPFFHFHFAKVEDRFRFSVRRTKRMISDIPGFLRRSAPLLLMIAYFPVAAYCGFNSILSVWTGVSHMSHADWWIPLLAGLTLLAAVSWISFFVIRRVASIM